MLAEKPQLNPQAQHEGLLPEPVTERWCQSTEARVREYLCEMALAVPLPADVG